MDGYCVRAVSIGEWMVTVCVPCPQWSGWLLCACRDHNGVDGYCVRAVSTGEMVRAKLETLRGQYVREMLRREAGARKLLPPKWKYFHHLEFLRDVITPRQASQNPQFRHGRSLLSTAFTERAHRAGG